MWSNSIEKNRPGENMVHPCGEEQEARTACEGCETQALLDLAELA